MIEFSWDLVEKVIESKNHLMAVSEASNMFNFLQREYGYW